MGLWHMLGRPSQVYIGFDGLSTGYTRADLALLLGVNSIHFVDKAILVLLVKARELIPTLVDQLR